MYVYNNNLQQLDCPHNIVIYLTPRWGGEGGVVAIIITRSITGGRAKRIINELQIARV